MHIVRSETSTCCSWNKSSTPYRKRFLCNSENHFKNRTVTNNFFEIKIQIKWIEENCWFTLTKRSKSTIWQLHDNWFDIILIWRSLLSEAKVPSGKEDSGFESKLSSSKDSNSINDKRSSACNWLLFSKLKKTKMAKLHFQWRIFNFIFSPAIHTEDRKLLLLTNLKLAVK